MQKKRIIQKEVIQSVPTAVVIEEILDNTNLSQNLSTEVLKVIPDKQHFVQFYEQDGFLIDSLADFVIEGLEKKEVSIIVATNVHLEELKTVLKARSIDANEIMSKGFTMFLDADIILAELLIDGMPDRTKFNEVIGNVLKAALKINSTVRVFGELVVLLYKNNNEVGAINLEGYWNDLNKLYDFQLFCAYPMSIFSNSEDSKFFNKICETHSHVIPTESYTSLSSANEQFRAISVLQQKAESLNAESNHSKKAEGALKISETRYRRLFETALDGVIIFDSVSEKIVDVNPFMENLLNKSREEIIGKDLFGAGFIKYPDENKDLIQNVLNNQSARFEKVFESLEGEEIVVDVVANTYEENDSRVIQYSIRDITERKNLEKQKDEFLNIASHELKTPVTSIKGYTQLLQSHLKNSQDTKSNFLLEKMDSQINKLTNLITDLLDISKIESGVLEFKKRPLNIDELVQETVDEMQLVIENRMIKEITPNLPVLGDRNRLGQVIINLIINASKYSKPDSNIIIKAEKKENRVVISVQDFGIGIDEEDQKKVFDRFFRANRGGVDPHSGLGLGLYISSEILRRHDGEIWVESEKEKGSTFYFALPAQS